MTVWAVSAGRAWRVIGQGRAPQPYSPHRAADEAVLRPRSVTWGQASGRDGGDVRIPGLVRGEGGPVPATRVERIWRPEGLTGPQQQPKRARLGVTNGGLPACAAPSLRLLCGHLPA